MVRRVDSCENAGSPAHENNTALLFFRVLLAKTERWKGLI